MHTEIKRYTTLRKTAIMGYVMRLKLKLLVCLGALFFNLLLEAGESEEITAISALIMSSSHHLDQLQKLKGQMERFEQLKKEFAQGGDERKIGSELIREAKDILTRIKASNLEKSLPAPYLKELSFFSSLRK